MNIFYKTFEISLGEMVSLLGLAQALWLVVFIVLRAGRIRNASLALACFLCLALAFLGDFGSRYLSELSFYPLVQDFFWLMLPAFSVLLVIQIARIDRFPDKKFFLILALPFIALVLSWAIERSASDCKLLSICDPDHMRQIMAVLGVLTGGMGLLCLWAQRSLLPNLDQEKHLKSDRYWAILALIITNCALMCVTLAYSSGVVEDTDFLLIRDVLGCGLVYLCSTSLFRIYPQALKVTAKTTIEFNEQEVVLTKKIEDLMALQKVYQEQGYGRDDLARELEVSEAVITRLVNVHFGKSVPQLINERRIDEAQRLLLQSNMAVSLVSEQVGFSSLPSFNRVFKEITGLSPSEYRTQNAALKISKV